MTQAQIKFLDQTFVGGVTGFGHTETLGFGEDSIKFRWQPSFTIKAAYAITYRYGRPEPYSMFVNDEDVRWNSDNQIGPELEDLEEEAQFYATNVSLLDFENINSNECLISFPSFDYSQDILNEGWWSLYIVVLYTSPEITTPVNVQLFTADQRQDTLQDYTVPEFNYSNESNVGFAIFSDRLGFKAKMDGSLISINDNFVGEIYGPDESSGGTSGVRGHFYYEDSTLFGLDDDVPNTTVNASDGIAVINDYLPEGQDHSFRFVRVDKPPSLSTNVIPAFVLTSTNDCPIVSTDFDREYTLCRGDTVQLDASTTYDSYSWTPDVGISDSTVAMPLCSPDSSTWYRVKMWDSTNPGCSQTIPVHVVVGQTPRPGKLNVRNSHCPANTGRIEFNDMQGSPSYTFNVGDQQNTIGSFNGLAPGSYTLMVSDSLGCTWDSTATIGLDPRAEAAFTANPDSGFSPLQVAFANQSIDATAFQWLVNGVPFSTSENTSYTFADSGSYEVALVAGITNTDCADTARATIIVEPGIEVIVPNIITVNGDGRNDALVAKLSGVKSLSWQVFNRWGRELHAGQAARPGSSVVLWAPEEGQYSAGVYTVSWLLKALAARYEGGL